MSYLGRTVHAVIYREGRLECRPAIVVAIERANIVEPPRADLAIVPIGPLDAAVFGYPPIGETHPLVARAGWPEADDGEQTWHGPESCPRREG